MRKAVTVILSMLLIICMLAGCSQSSGTSDNEKYKGQTVSGKIKEVSSDSITIGIGNPESDSESGEEAVFKISSDTEITRNAMGGPGMGGQPPEMPGSDSNGDSDSDSNNSANGSQPPQGQPPEMPGSDSNGDSDSDSNNSANGSQPPQGQPPEMPDMKGETIELSEISEGDFVSVVIDEDGKVSSVSVFGSDMNGEQQSGSESSGQVEAKGATTVDGDEETLNDTY